ncbi:MAG: hypothetical protein K2L11_03300 [Muribaculaceae bacterium]|nr:hypothetical protein [Muribaculaceae bacterium]
MNSKANPDTKAGDETKPVLSQEEYKHKRLVINITWIICLLVLAIIGLSSIICCGYITNADTIKIFIEYSATLLSITLSIFAIAFTYTSNNSMQHQFDKIDNAARVIVESSNSLQRTERELTGSIGQLHERITRIEADVNFIKGNIPNSIPKNIPIIEPTKQNLVNIQPPTH